MREQEVTKVELDEDGSLLLHFYGGIGGAGLPIFQGIGAEQYAFVRVKPKPGVAFAL